MKRGRFQFNQLFSLLFSILSVGFEFSITLFKK
jgi:hypothetical protein